MKFNKKLLAASVAAMFIAAPAYAENTIDAEWNEILLDEILDSSLDMDDAMVRSVSAAINLAPIDASVNITGASIDFNGANAASADANAAANSSVTDANATVTAIANATSGNSIKTNAIGAVNDTVVDVTNSLAYLRDSTTTTSLTLDGEAEDVTINDAVNGAYAAGEYGFFAGLGGVLVGEDMFGDTENGVAVFQAAYNTGDINASVNIASAASLDSNYYNRGIGENLDITDLAITTSAIGAVNNGGVTIVNELVVDVKTNVSSTVSSDVTELLGNTVP